MTKELIENIRTIMVPYMAYDLRRINYENMGEIDAEQFKEDMNEILDLAAKALEQEPCYNPDEWCHDCSEYDHDKHCCPRYNKVIRSAVEEMKQPKMGHWIPVKFRPLTDEEQKEYPDYFYIADCPMPDDGEEILVSTKHGSVGKDECGFDNGYYLDSGYDWQTDIVAWMPLPEPYEPQESEDKE